MKNKFFKVSILIFSVLFSVLAFIVFLPNKTLASGCVGGGFGGNSCMLYNDNMTDCVNAPFGCYWDPSGSGGDSGGAQRCYAPDGETVNCGGGSFPTPSLSCSPSSIKAGHDQFTLSVSGTIYNAPVDYYFRVNGGTWYPVGSFCTANSSGSCTNTFPTSKSAGEAGNKFQFYVISLGMPSSPCEIDVVAPPISAPIVTTSSCSSITQTSATSGGDTTSDVGATVTQAGLVWGQSSSPTTDGNTGITYNGWAVGGPWASNLTGLTTNTTYHVRAYATNSVGTSYGNEVTCTTPNAVPIPALSAKWTGNGLTTYTINIVPGQTTYTIPFTFWNSGQSGSTLFNTECSFFKIVGDISPSNVFFSSCPKMNL